jgi:hypothetical protein
MRSRNGSYSVLASTCDPVRLCLRLHGTSGAGECASIGRDNGRGSTNSRRHRQRPGLVRPKAESRPASAPRDPGSAHGLIALSTSAKLSTATESAFFQRRRSPPLLARVLDVDARHSYSADRLDAGMYWLLPEVRTLVPGGLRGTLSGISLDDGLVRWQLEVGEKAAIDGSVANRSIVIVGDALIRVYKLPAGGGADLRALPARRDS